MERDEGFGEGETCTQLIIVGSPSGIRTNAHCWDDCGVGQVHGFGCRVTMVICRQTSSLPCHPARKLMHSHTQTHYLLTHVLTLAPYSALALEERVAMVASVEDLATCAAARAAAHTSSNDVFWGKASTHACTAMTCFAVTNNNTGMAIKCE